MTSVRGRGRPCKERISEASSKPSVSAGSDYKGVVSPIVDPSAGSIGPLVAKYTKEDLQQILKAVLEAQVPASNEPCEKLLKAKSLDVYRGKSHIECYNFCQQCKDHFVTAGAKGPNRIPFAVSFLCDHINFQW